MTVFLYAFRERELILDLFEEFCGARLTYNSMRIGGLPQDIPPGWDKKVLEFCDIMDEKIDEYEELLTHNRIWLERTKGIGVISGAEAVGARAERPAAARFGRAARRPQGRAVRRVRRDGVRRADRHGRRHLRSVSRADGGVPAVAAHHPAGDRRAFPKGRSSARCRASSSRPAGETYHAIESPKGELGYFIVSDGKSTNPYRFRVRPPSFCNLQGLRALVQGPPGRRRRRAHRLARRRARRGRSVID